MSTFRYLIICDIFLLLTGVYYLNKYSCVPMLPSSRVASLQNVNYPTYADTTTSFEIFCIHGIGFVPRSG